MLHVQFLVAVAKKKKERLKYVPASLTSSCVSIFLAVCNSSLTAELIFMEFLLLRRYWGGWGRPAIEEMQRPVRLTMALERVKFPVFGDDKEEEEKEEVEEEEDRRRKKKRRKRREPSWALSVQSTFVWNQTTITSALHEDLFAFLCSFGMFLAPNPLSIYLSEESLKQSL